MRLKGTAHRWCAHCWQRRTRVQNPLSLCTFCNRDPYIRERYERIAAGQEDDDCNDDATTLGVPRCAKPALMPTQAQPGSAEKIATMAARYARGQRIHHPDDYRGQDTVEDAR